MISTLYIHIGRPKVGSTAIQRFLKFNRSLLLEKGVLYPETGERENASHLLAEALDSKSDAAGQREELFATLVRELADSPAQVAVLSSENLYFVDPGLLKKQFPATVDIKIVCYVRRQDEVLVSSYIQEMKDGSLDPGEELDLDRYLGNSERLRLLDYKHVLDRWAAVYGQSNIIVRVFEKEQLKGDLFGDIRDVLGLQDDPAFVVPPSRVNPTPTTDVLELIKVVNAYDVSPLLKRQLKSRLVELSETLDYDPAFDAKRAFTPAQRAKALAGFDASNAATARDYLGRSDGVLFRRGVEAGDDDVALSADKYSLERLAELWLGMLATQQRRINTLERKIQKIYDALQPPED